MKEMNKMFGMKHTMISNYLNIYKLSSEQRLERQLVENFNRQDMKLVDSIEAVKKLIQSPEYKRLYSGHGVKDMDTNTLASLGEEKDWSKAEIVRTYTLVS